MTENYNLKTVHRLFSQGRYDDAHAILKHLTNTFPEFELYKNKLKECDAFIQNNKRNSAASIPANTNQAKIKTPPSAPQNETWTAIITMWKRTDTLIRCGIVFLFSKIC